MEALLRDRKKEIMRMKRVKLLEEKEREKEEGLQRKRQLNQYFDQVFKVKVSES